MSKPTSTAAPPLPSTKNNNIKLIDIAVNLADPMFRGVYRQKLAHQDDLKLVLQRAHRMGVEKIIATGTSLEDSIETLELASNQEFGDEIEIFTTVGVHPTNAQDFEKDMSPIEYELKLKELILNNLGKVVAIGECGLDYDRLHFCPKEIQIKYFETQLNIANEIKLPLFLHNRNTQGDFLSMIKTHRSKFTTGVVHSYDGSLEEALELIALDLYIGINGCSMKTPENIEVIRNLPLDRILIETDAPWCDIRPSHASYPLLLQSLMKDTTIYHPNNQYKINRKEKFVLGDLVKSRNEPCNVMYIVCVLSELYQLPIAEVVSTVYNNTMNVFFPTSSSNQAQ